MAAYYNEIEPHAAQWLRNLIAAGRSIYLLPKTARKRADAVAWAIYHQQVAKDKA